MSRSDVYEIAHLRELLYKAGICADCGEEMSHDVEEPFSHCKCGTTEDTIGPGTIQKLRMDLAREKIVNHSAIDSALSGTYTYATLGVTSQTFKEIGMSLQAAGYFNSFIHKEDHDLINMAGIALKQVFVPGGTITK